MNLDKNRKSYKEGYKTGLDWKDNYRPGGPLVFYPRPNDSVDFKEKCAEMKLDREHYLAGFDDATNYRFNKKS